MKYFKAKVKLLTRRSDYICIKILSFDPGLTVTGVAFLIYTRIDGEGRLSYKTHAIKVRGKDHSSRIHDLHTKVEYLVGEVGTFNVGITEGIFVNINGKTATVLAYAKAICLMGISIAPIRVEVFNGEVKNLMTGRTWYDKITLARTLSFLLNHNLERGDSTDALALGLVYLLRSGLNGTC